jgi:hypothetical protein
VLKTDVGSTLLAVFPPSRLVVIVTEFIRLFYFRDKFFVILFYLQSLPVHVANYVKIYTVACRRGLSSAPL